jgi:hypothetical protein
VPLQLKYWLMKTFVCTLLVVVAASSAFGEDVPNADPIKGVWKLNVGKSRNAIAPESEIITIVKEDGSYKLTFDVKQSNGYNSKYDIVTDMKGGTVKPVNADGRGTSDIWRVTRQNTKSFDMQLKIRFGGEWTYKYEVSSDGKTMTLHRIPSPNNMVFAGLGLRPSLVPSGEPQYFFVFDRVE